MDSNTVIAPLNVAGRKSPMPSNQRLMSAFQVQLHMTPPLTPHSSREQMVDRSDQARPIFHNFLRAFYPFQPDGPISASTVTLPLSQGDLILVHSVHTNGWADGTLLDSGARGWLPTNYCEAYELSAAQPLLKALTDFWDIIRSGSGSTLHQFSNQDYMRGIIAGVRFLLEQSECLTRDCDLVRAVDGLRRNRKALLSDLSSLVKLAKRLQDVANGGELDEPLDNLFDLMLLKAFKIVTRGVRFLDVWNEEVGLSRAMEELERRAPQNPFAYDAPLTPPVDASFSTSAPYESGSPSIAKEQTDLQPHALPDPASYTAPSVHRDPISRARQLAVQANRVSVSHRISYNGHSTGIVNPNLASERLGAAYDEFLGVLGSFIGLHLQSRSSSELMLTTQQSVHSCKELLAVVDEVLRHDLHRSELLRRAQDAMYDKITELVHAAREVFRPANPVEEEALFMPDDGKRLVDAATDCVRGAGECVAKARHVLEQIGDFEMETTIGLGITTAPESADTMSSAVATPRFDQHSANQTNDTFRLPPPPLQIPTPSHYTSSTEPTPGSSEGPTPSSPFSTNTIQTPDSPLDEPMTPCISDFAHLDGPLIPIPSADLGLDFHARPLESAHGNASSENIMSHTSAGSDITCVTDIRDSESYALSQTSTRATSPDFGVLPLPVPQKDCATSIPEEQEEGEETLLEKTFAHELMFKDGQVTGGSLRALVEKLTAHQSTPDALFVSTFYLTFRHFASPSELAAALIDRFDYVADTPKIASPVRLRVYNIFKGWLESHWRHDCDDVALPAILKFARTKLMITLPTAGKRLVDLVDKVSTLHGPLVPRFVSSMGKTNTSTAQYVSPDAPTPAPVISRSQTNLLKQWKAGAQTIGILDFDPLELARQITIKSSTIFCSILPEELLGTEWMKKSGSLAVNVRAMSTLSTDLANLVADSILHLEEPKKRALVIKQWVKIASRCLELNNYDTLMAIVCSLNSSTISRLKRTWELVSQKTKALLEQLREIVDVSRNYAVLRQRLQNHVPPCLPFVGTYLTDLTFVDHGNQNTRNLCVNGGRMDVINFDKHMKTAKIISELQRFQIPYRLQEIPELQTWIQDQLIRVRSAGEKSFQAYYRRSLVLEPREQPTHRGSPGETSIFSREGGKDKFDFLSWTHSSKSKAVAG